MGIATRRILKKGELGTARATGRGCSVELSIGREGVQYQLLKCPALLLSSPSPQAQSESQTWTPTPLGVGVRATPPSPHYLCGCYLCELMEVR